MQGKSRVDLNTNHLKEKRLKLTLRIRELEPTIEVLSWMKKKNNKLVRMMQMMMILAGKSLNILMSDL